MHENYGICLDIRNSRRLVRYSCTDSTIAMKEATPGHKQPFSVALTWHSKHQVNQSRMSCKSGADNSLCRNCEANDPRSVGAYGPVGLSHHLFTKQCMEPPNLELRHIPVEDMIHAKLSSRIIPGLLALLAKIAMREAIPSESMCKGGHSRQDRTAIRSRSYFAYRIGMI